MPAISLVVCLHNERDLLKRLLEHADGCFDDLVVVHDGPEDFGNLQAGTKQPGAHLQEVYVPSHRWPEIAVDYSIPEDAEIAGSFWKEKIETPAIGSVHELVSQQGGRFFEGPRCWQQEPHWPFAWSQAKHDWILRLDADEYPSRELSDWLINFRKVPARPNDVSGYTCRWPLWDGRKSLKTPWPDGRNFLFRKSDISFAGVVELVPEAKTRFQPVSLTLCHTPNRKSFGYRNIIFRKQAYFWRRVIALSLLESPMNLPRWQMRNQHWPEPFKRIREHPLRYFFECLLVCPRFGLKALVKNRMWTVLYSFPASHWHHALICLDYMWLKARR